MNLDQLRKFTSRAVTARHLGLAFLGTSLFRLPRAVRLNGQNRVLSFPDDCQLALDIIDVWMDDDYGLKTVAPPVSTVLDIGANVGIFSLWAWHNFPAARIHAYEPNAAVLPHLRANLAGLTNIEIWPEGISHREARARMLAHSSSRLAQTEIDEHGEIVINTIGRAIERLGGTVDILKLDCEGAEWSIFRKPESVRLVREIRMEYHLTEGRTLADLEVAAILIGFEITYLRENNGFGIAFLSNQLQARPREANRRANYA